MRKMILMVAVLVGMLFMFSQGAFAQACDPKDPKCEPPKEGIPCSPGFYKNHIDFWFNIYCDDVSSPTCTDLLTALTCKGSDDSCGRSDAAAFLNAQSGCTE